MTITEEAKLLKDVPIFSKVDAAKLKLLAFTSERMTFAPGQEVCHQGDQANTMYLILGGTADVLIDSESGQIAVAELKKDSFFDELAILCDMPRPATVRARESLSTLKISKDIFHRLVAECPELAVEVMRVLACRPQDTPVTVATNGRTCWPQCTLACELAGHEHFPPVFRPDLLGAIRSTTDPPPVE